MTEGNKLKTLIEKVDPANTAIMDEISARAWCWLNNYGFVSTSDPFNSNIFMFAYDEIKYDVRNVGATTPDYARDLNALKAVQDEHLAGWLFNFSTHPASSNNIWCALEKEDAAYVVSHRPLPTMHLAWLHALIQGIEWKRENEGES